MRAGDAKTYKFYVKITRKPNTRVAVSLQFATTLQQNSNVMCCGLVAVVMQCCCILVAVSLQFCTLFILVISRLLMFIFVLYEIIHMLMKSPSHNCNETATRMQHTCNTTATKPQHITLLFCYRFVAKCNETATRLFGFRVTFT